MDTRTWSSRSPARSGSPAGEPIAKLPAGTTTISGQSAQSLKRSPAPGLRQRASPVPSSTLTPSQDCAAAGRIAGAAIAEATVAAIVRLHRRNGPPISVRAILPGIIAQPIQPNLIQLRRLD